MNGAQDLGGMMGFGPVAPEKDEPIFHAGWERRAFGLALAMGATGSWTLDASRHARESLPPAEYLTSSYYEIWIKGLTRLLLARPARIDPRALWRPADRAWPAPRACRRGQRTCRALLAQRHEILPGGRRRGEVLRRRCRPRSQRAQAHPYARAALRARAPRADRRRQRRLRLSGHQRPWPGREPAMVLQRAVHRPRALGRGRRSDARGDGRSLGILP